VAKVTAKDILLAVIIPLALAEFGPWCGWLAARLLPWAAKLRYGDTERTAVRLEEWSGDLGDIPGQLTKLAYAIGQLAAGSAVSAQRKTKSALRWSRPSVPALVPGTAFIGYVPNLPSKYVVRADIFDGVRHDVVSYGTIGLVGMGGSGKSVLAAAIARDRAVQAAFPDGVVWVAGGPRATPTQLQERLAARLTGEAVSFPAVEVGRHRLAELLADRAFLLVIDDVRDAEALNALNVVGAPRGALLFTTRDRSIARAVGVTAREVDALALEQALALLGSWTDTDFDRLPPVADRLCLQVGNLALAVALAGQMVKDRGAQPGDWQDVIDLLASGIQHLPADLKMTIS
jgi:NB-ARC domain